MARSRSTTDTDTADEGGGVEYIDQGDKWLVIDNRGSVQRRKTVPKSIRDIGVAPTVRADLEAQYEAAKERDEALANEDPLVTVPPAESDEDREKREKEETEALARADEQRKESYEDVAVEEAKSKQPDPTAGSASNT